MSDPSMSYLCTMTLSQEGNYHAGETKTRTNTSKGQTTLHIWCTASEFLSSLPTYLLEVVLLTIGTLTIKYKMNVKSQSVFIQILELKTEWSLKHNVVVWKVGRLDLE